MWEYISTHPKAMSIFNGPLPTPIGATAIDLTATADQIVTSSASATPGTLSIPTPGQATVYTFADPGAATASVILGTSTGGQTLTGGLTVDTLTFSPGVQSALNGFYAAAWTPVFTTGSGSGPTYTSAGAFVRIGYFVWITGTCTCTALGTSAGQFLIGGFPYANGSGNAIYFPLTNLVGLTYASAGEMLSWQMVNASKSVNLVRTQSAGSVTAVTVAGNLVAANASFVFSGSYLTNDPF
jgi:hypothetical protein